MNFSRRFRCVFLLAVATAVAAPFVWAADVQEVALPSATSALFLRQQQEIESELRNGVGRLKAACKRKPAPASASPIPEILSAQARLRTRAAALALEEEATEQQVRTRLRSLQQRQSESCGGLEQFLRKLRDENRPAQCAALDQAINEASLIQEALLKYRVISKNRQSLLGEMLDLETRSCTRAGFTARMIDMVEANNRGSETGLSEFFLGLIQQAEAFARNAPGESP